MLGQRKILARVRGVAWGVLGGRSAAAARGPLGSRPRVHLDRRLPGGPMAQLAGTCCCVPARLSCWGLATVCGLSSRRMRLFGRPAASSFAHRASAPREAQPVPEVVIGGCVQVVSGR